MSNRLRVGVVGLERLGSSYVRYFNGRIARAEIAAVSDVNETAATALAAELGISKKYGSYQDLIADEAVEGVVIVSPTSTHKEIVLAAAKRGLPILCEKPLSISLDKAREMLRIVEQTGVFFQMGFMRRFDKGYLAAKRKIDEGLIGNPVVFKSSRSEEHTSELQSRENLVCR